MELEIVKKLILSYADVHAKYQAEALKAERYYKNETDNSHNAMYVVADKRMYKQKSYRRT